MPFVDDSHLLLDDPDALEAIGRRHGEGTWGRTDRRLRKYGDGWLAFTTEMGNRDLAWVVSFHPEHGRTVLLVRDEDASTIYIGFSDRGLLFRAGDYWWDGTDWFRPPQIWDPVREEYLNRKVPGARTVTAADFLQNAGNPARASIADVTSIRVPPGSQDDQQDAQDRDTRTGIPAGRWVDDLAAWAEQREVDARPLDQCVITLTAPELTADQLVGTGEMAKIAGLASSTLRAYIARNEASVPQPQATISGRSVWSRPVAEEWAENRSLDVSPDRPVGPDGVVSLSVGLDQVRDRFARMFMSRLWENPTTRKRWALRWRSENAVRELAVGLGLDVAANLRNAIPISALKSTVFHALVDEMADGLDTHRTVGEDAPVYLGITRPVARMLAWLILTYPDSAKYAITDAISEAQRRLGLSPEVTAASIRTALALDTDAEFSQTTSTFIDKVLAPVLAQNN